MWQAALLLGVSFFVELPRLVETVKSGSELVIARTTNGQVEGRLIFTDDSVSAVFLGIPFAEPPVGGLRFRNPVPAKPWTGVLKCDQYKAACYQNRSMRTVQWLVSEDCLYVNVFVGQNCTTDNTCPVIYYIHGGGFEFDSPNMFSPDVIVRNFASKGIVFVTVGYRLGVLGFFTTGTLEATGNYGAQDIVEGLRWVKREIRNFGGDADRVTIMGHSSGGSVVSLLTLSPATAGLFKQAIAMSGTAFAPGTLRTDSAPYQRWAEQVGCPSERTATSKADVSDIGCLRNLSVDFVVQNFTLYEDDVGFRAGPTVDGPGGLFPDTVERLAKKRRPTPYLLGTMSKEFTFNARAALGSSNFSTKSLCKTAMELTGLEPTFSNVIRCVITYFVKPLFSKKSNVTAMIEQQAANLLSDVILFVPVYMDASNMQSRKGDVYLYSFDYVKEGMEVETEWTHSMDLTYVLGIHPFNFTEQDLKIQEIYLDVLRNFTIFGNPTPKAVGKQKWLPVKAYPQSNYYSINLTSEMRPQFRQQSLSFWQELMDDDDYEQTGLETIFGSGRISGDGAKLIGKIPAALAGNGSPKKDAERRDREMDAIRRIPEASQTKCTRDSTKTVSTTAPSPTTTDPRDQETNARKRRNFWIYTSFSAVLLVMALLVATVCVQYCCGRPKKVRKEKLRLLNDINWDPKKEPNKIYLYQTF